VARDRSARPEAKPLRLFVAVDLPQDVREALAGLVADLRERVPGARWTRPEGWHVTLKFLGSTWPRLVTEVTSVVTRVASAAATFETSLGGTGAFPSARRARVLWVGLRDAGGGFAGLSGALDAGLRTWFEPERRPYTPHLTLARIDPPAALAQIAPDVLTVPFASRSFPVEALVLYRSHLGRGGATYEALHTATLGGGG
jgi:2'-5' RNA ligase